jgi:hypothetical protein
MEVVERGGEEGREAERERRRTGRVGTMSVERVTVVSPGV